MVLNEKKVNYDKTYFYWKTLMANILASMIRSHAGTFTRNTVAPQKLRKLYSRILFAFVP